ncbi:MAG: calpastatin [Flavobacteriaceae bacterium]|nr:MAG: calpastatin [Flavobacteriaceae bacterium]
MHQSNLNHFQKAQDFHYTTALSEIKNGKKHNHWMWFIFPQVLGLGNSEVSKRFGISSIEEATAYLDHPILGARLICITTEVLNLKNTTPTKIFGILNAKKLHSSMTLFAEVSSNTPVFAQVLAKYYGNQRCKRSLELLEWHMKKNLG